MAKTNISEFMIENPVSVSPSMNVYEAAHEILTNQVSGVAVIDENGKLAGMLSELDCLQAIVTSVYNGADPGGALVSDIMTADVEVNDPEDEILAVAKSMLDHKHRRRPVVKDGVFQGQLTCRQILKAVTDFADENHAEDLKTD
jgi:CBS domain-containing protein